MNTIDQPVLSKQERRRLKKEQKQLRRLKAIRRKQLTKWGTILAVIILLVGAFSLSKALKAKRYQNKPKIQLTPASYNFDNISASDGVVKTSFEVKNVGVSPFTLTGIVTSCGCTSAKLRTKDQQSNTIESPTFGMHNNPTNWSVSLDPNQTAELSIFFDPNFHQNASGPVTRTISIFSNDPGKSEAQLTIYANVQR